MGLRLKLVVLILFVGLAPLALSTFGVLDLAQRAISERTSALLAQSAKRAAEQATDYLADVADDVSHQAKSIRWDALTPAERTGALTLIFKEREEMLAVTLLDARGEGVGEAVYGDDMTSAKLAKLAEHLPFGQPDIQFSAPFDGMIALSVPLTSGAVAAGLSLDGLCRRMHDEGALRMYLRAPDGSFVCGAPSASEVVRDSAPAAYGWTATAEQTTNLIDAPRRAIRRQTFIWAAIAVVAAITTGMLLGGNVITPLRTLSAAAEQMARGNLAQHVDIKAGDEVGALAQSFNHMAAEIRAWNAELTARVEARTRELHDAQEQLVASRKMAAVTSLGAGIAHEINNPLTGVLGLTQVLKKIVVKETSPEKVLALLDTIEHESRRIKTIVATLLTLSQTQTVSGASEVDINAVIDEVLADMELPGITVERHYQQLPAVSGHRAQLHEAISHLVANARQAMQAGGMLAVRTQSIEGKLVKIVISDTGKGIAPEHLPRIFDPFFTTKDNWTGQGLGLTAAFRVIAEHLGKIKAESVVGQGTQMTIVLPVTAQGAHLV